MNALARAACALGVVAVIAMVTSEDAQKIFGLLSQVGWRLLFLPILRLLPLYPDVMGWRLLLLAPVRLPALFLIAAIREAINRLLPVANIGGELVGVPLLVRQGAPWHVAAASIIVEMLLTMVSLYLFAVLGFFCLYRAAGHTSASAALLMSLLLSLPVLILLLALMARGSLLQRIEQVTARLLRALGQGSAILANLPLVNQSIRRLMTSPMRLARATVWQLLGHIATCLETWLILQWLKAPVPIVAVVAIEGLTQAIRSVFFVVPGGLGVQEAGFIGLGSFLGIDPPTALALSLTKRFREVLFGLPALGFWQLLEARGVARALPSSDR